MNNNAAEILPVLASIKPNHLFKKGDTVFIVCMRIGLGGSIINKYLKQFIGQTAVIEKILNTDYKPYLIKLPDGTLRANEDEISLIKGASN